MSRYLIALDCSFTRTGICIIDLVEKKIYFYTASEKIGEKQFENVVHAGQSIVNQLKTIFNAYSNDYDLIIEAPLPMSSMSAALYSLDTLIYNEFESHIKMSYNPATLRSRIHGRKYDKNDSVNLASKYLKILEDNGYIINTVIGTKKKITHDNAEAFLYAHLYLTQFLRPYCSMRKEKYIFYKKAFHLLIKLLSRNITSKHVPEAIPQF